MQNASVGSEAVNLWPFSPSCDVLSAMAKAKTRRGAMVQFSWNHPESIGVIDIHIEYVHM